MRIVLLTTETAHHAFFARQLKAQAGLDAIFVESRRVAAPFSTAHPFERRRDEYERSVLVNGGPASCAGVTDTFECASVNDAASVATLRRLQPDLLFVFGTGKISEDVYRSARLACLNLHGGNPERYRGLDSHLWTIYHEDFGNLVTTLHHVDDQLDTGAIAFQQMVPLERSTGLHEVRAINTGVCVELAVHAVRAAAEGQLPARPQSQRGRYFSFMPTELKEQCLIKLQRHLARQ